jgi:DNA ligase 1
MFIQPMLLTKCEPFSNPDWIYEPKMDGIRLILSQQSGQIQLYTRHQNNVTSRYPELHHLPISNDVILDGELICYDPNSSKVDFELCMERFMARGTSRSKELPVHYVVFDILYYDGKDIRKYPLHKRKQILQDVLSDTENISKMRYIEGLGEPLFESARNMDLEGIVAKRFNSIYESRRSNDWRKIINWRYEELYITGYKKDDFGWLCSVEENGQFRYVGVLEYGPSSDERKAFYQVAKSLIVEERDNVVIIEPVVKAKVKIRNWTRNKMLRTPVFCEFLF